FVLEMLRIFLTGSTGFVGRVLVEKLLWSVPDVGKLYLLIRPGAERTADDRLREEVLGSEAMARLRERQRAEGAERAAFISWTSSVPAILTRQTFRPHDNRAPTGSGRLRASQVAPPEQHDRSTSSLSPRRADHSEAVAQEARPKGRGEERERGVREVEVLAVLAVHAEGHRGRAVEAVGRGEQDLRRAVRRHLDQTVERIGPAVESAVDVEREVVAAEGRR